MKRSELKRKTPIKNRSELKTKSPINHKREKRSAPKRKSSDTRWRSPHYLAWVRTLPCCACGITPCDAHHMVGMYGVGGMGLKAEDSMAMPLCRACHMELHREPGWLQHQPRWLRLTIALGVREFGGEIRDALVQAWHFIEEREAA